MPVLVEKQLSDDWFSARGGRITASIAAGALGMNPHMSRQEAWRRALGIEKDSGNRHTRWGSEFEPMARSAYEVETGNMVIETGFWVHPTFDWLGASPDGLIGTDGLLEIKCPTACPESVPLPHRVQMLVQLIVTGRKWCDYFVWTHDKTFLKRVHLAGEAGLLRRLEAFYSEFVLTKTEPPRKRRKR